MSLTPGTRLAHYEIVSSLGSGGMGEVYRAPDLRLDREVAIKVMARHIASDPDMRRRFETEAKAVAALSHPAIMSIYELAFVDDFPMAAMELLEGETLRARMKKGALVWREAVEIGASVAEGLAAAHTKGIIHRDLKPENIFLTREGVIKILVHLSDAVIHTHLSHTERVREHAEHMVDQHVGRVVFLGVDPCVSVIRSEPRYDALIRRVGIPLRTASGSHTASR